MTWHWPQFVMAALIFVGIGHSLARFGQQKTDRYDWTDLILGPAIAIVLLYYGGFWTPAP